MEGGINPNRVVVDASVVLAWLLPDEILKEYSNALVRGYEQGSVDILCPSLLVYEVLNGLRSAVLSKRIPESQLDEAYKRYVSLLIPIENDYYPDNTTVNLSMTYNLSLYDTAYIHFAQVKNRKLVTADKKFSALAAPTKRELLYLGDYDIA